MFITLALVFACIVTPYRIAFVEKDGLDWVIINGFVDVLFLLDILIIFNTATYDEDFITIDCRRRISLQYIQSWFFIDLLSIIPFDHLLHSSNRSTSMARIVRIGRMYKLVKLTRLLKMLRLVKDRSKLLKYVNEVMRIGVGCERLFFFVLLFLLMAHIVSCLWVLSASMEDDKTGTWLESISESSATEQYITSIYFTIETITTVGYGDYGP
jgi:voltage-gated potassium channel Kch